MTNDYQLILTMTQHESIPRGDFDELMANSAQGMKESGARIIGLSPLSGGLRGQEMVVELDRYAGRSRTILEGDRLYSVTIYTPKGQAAAPQVNRFLDSFKLKVDSAQ